MKDGYKVTVVQNPTTSLSDDVAFTRRAIDESSGRVILVGHSYGGVVITQAGNDPRGVLEWRARGACSDGVLGRRALTAWSQCGPGSVTAI